MKKVNVVFDDEIDDVDILLVPWVGVNVLSCYLIQFATSHYIVPVT